MGGRASAYVRDRHDLSKNYQAIERELTAIVQHGHQSA
jgi:hypothetical protein